MDCKSHVPAMSYYMLSTTACHAGKDQKEPAQQQIDYDHETNSDE